MSDLISATSLLLAMVSILFGLWYMEIQNVINLTVPKHKDDRAPDFQKVNHFLYQKALPLAIFAILLSFIVLPDFISILRDTVKIFIIMKCEAFKKYDAVRAAYILVSLYTFALSVYLVSLLLKIWDKHREFKN